MEGDRKYDGVDWCEGSLSIRYLNILFEFLTVLLMFAAVLDLLHEEIFLKSGSFL